MTSEAWIALGALVFTILTATAAAIVFLSGSKNEILQRMADDKESIDEELKAIRMSAYEEYTTLRKEIGEATSIARVEFGETVRAIREKINEIELWTRDQLSETRHTILGGMDQRHVIAIEMIEKIEDRMRLLELFSAGKGYRSD